MRVRAASTDGPLLPSQLVSLTCSISFPTPPGGVYYLWRTTLQDRTRTPSPPLNARSSTVLMSITEDTPPVLRVFCHVLASEDDSYLGVGSVDIEVEGKSMLETVICIVECIGTGV